MAKADLPTPEYLRQRLRYEPETGKLFWRDTPMMDNNWRVMFINQEALFTVNANGYKAGRVDGRPVQAHRVIWAIVTGAWPEGEIDHIDHDRTNNKWDNLREVSKQENLRNRPKSRNNTSGHVGVGWHKLTGKWSAQIRIDGKLKHLGLFENIEDAVLARAKASKEHGFHPNHGT